MHIFFNGWHTFPKWWGRTQTTIMTMGNFRFFWSVSICIQKDLHINLNCRVHPHLHAKKRWVHALEWTAAPCQLVIKIALCVTTLYDSLWSVVGCLFWVCLTGNSWCNSLWVCMLAWLCTSQNCLLALAASWLEGLTADLVRLFSSAPVWKGLWFWIA